MKVKIFCCPRRMQKKKRKQNYRCCLWCPKRGIESPRKFARVTALERHQAKCKAAYLLENGPNTDAPTRQVLFEMVMSQAAEIASLKGRMARLEERRNAPRRADRQMSPRECWSKRKDTMRAVFRHFGKRNFDIWFDVDNVDGPNILAAVLFPCLELRGEKMCIKDVATDDVYHMAKQFWGKSSHDVDLWWFKELCEDEFGQTLGPTFRDANESLMKTYDRFVQTDCRHGGNLAPQGLVRLARLWEKMTENFSGFVDELYGPGIDIFSSPTEETQQSDGSLVILKHAE